MDYSISDEAPILAGDFWNHFDTKDVFLSLPEKKMYSTCYVCKSGTCTIFGLIKTDVLCHQCLPRFVVGNADIRKINMYYSAEQINKMRDACLR
jgi:hypothetical protein